MDKIAIIHTPESIRDYINHFQKSRILLTAFELDIFTVIGTKSKTSIEVAKAIKADSRATDRLMNAVCTLGFLIKRNDNFYNTKETLKYFVKGKSDYMSSLNHTVSIWQTWNNLTDCVKKGSSVYDRPTDINDRGNEWLESFIAAMHYRAYSQAPQIVKMINLKSVRKVLDLGGGSGAFAMAFANASTNITATVFDLPNVTPIAKKYITKYKMTKKVNTFSGNYNHDNIPKGYDIIFLSAIVHINSYNENVKLIKKCAKSLNKGGQIIIQDQIMDNKRISPAGGALFALNMLVGTEKGDTYTETEICEWFEKSSISFENRIETFMGNSLMIGRKV